MRFAFSVPTRLRFGPGASREAGREAARLTQRPAALVVTDPGVQAAGLLDDVLEALKAEGLRPNVFDRVEPNPRDVTAQAAAEQLQREGAGVVVALGGGSVIDTAKGAALVATHGGRITEYAGWEKVPGPTLPVIAIPTTAGTGSEVTFWAVITDSDSHAKLAIGDPHLAPGAALVDPLLTHSLPPALTVATGLDALTHAIEAYTCTLANPASDVLALQAIQLIAAYLRRAVANGQDAEAREGMLLAATLAGIAFNNADVAGVHCLSEAIGSLYDSPHGVINAVLLPYVMAYNRPAGNGRYLEIARSLGAEPRAEAAVRHLVDLARTFDLPTLAELGVKPEDLPRLAAMSAANVSNASNPRPMTQADYLHVLGQALAGAPPL